MPIASSNSTAYSSTSTMPMKSTNDDDFLVDEDSKTNTSLQNDHQPIQSDAPINQPPPAYNSLDISFTARTGQQVDQRRYTGGDTLDEAISTTLMRDFRSIGWRLRQVVWHTPSTSLTAVARSLDENNNLDNAQDCGSSADQEWDLWGPLVFSLIISLCLSMFVPSTQSSVVFSGVFALIWIGQAIITLNIKLLGAGAGSDVRETSISFFQALSVTGYCLFPLIPAVLVSSFVRLLLVRVIVDAMLVAWAIYAATKGLQDSGVKTSRVFLAMFPVGLFYTGLVWLCVIS